MQAVRPIQCLSIHHLFPDVTLYSFSVHAEPVHKKIVATSYYIPHSSTSLSSSDRCQHSRLWTWKTASSIILSHTKHFLTNPSHSCSAIPSPSESRSRISRWSRRRWRWAWRRLLGLTGLGPDSSFDILAKGAPDVLAKGASVNVIVSNDMLGFRWITNWKGQVFKNEIISGIIITCICSS